MESESSKGDSFKQDWNIFSRVAGSDTIELLGAEGALETACRLRERNTRVAGSIGVKASSWNCWRRFMLLSFECDECGEFLRGTRNFLCRLEDKKDCLVMGTTQLPWTFRNATLSRKEC